MVPVPKFKLNTGALIPAVGLGTWQSPPGQVSHAVEAAIKAGYRHIDCAYVYGNEAEVGEGIKRAGIPRSELFITSKLWCTYHSRVQECLDKTLASLGTDYVDLYLIHWPVPLNPNGNDPKFPKKEDGTRDLDTNWTVAQTWAEMEKVYEGGKVKAIGVSNFSQPFLEKLLRTAKVTPAANQIELHPYLPQHSLVDYLKAKGIVAEAYSPLGSTDSPLLKDEEVVKIAEAKGVSTGTILISYQVARGVVVLPKSVTESRIKSNFELVDLTEDEMKILNSLANTKAKRFIKPDWNTPLGFDDWN